VLSCAPSAPKGGRHPPTSQGTGAYKFVAPIVTPTITGGRGENRVAVGAHKTPTATTATVTVSGFSLSVIPGWNVRITQSASVPVEKVTATSGEFTNSEGLNSAN